MQIIVGILVAIMLVLLVFELLLPLLFVTILLDGAAILSGVAVVFVVNYFFSLLITTAHNVARLVTFRFDGRQLIADVPDRELAKFGRPRLLKILASSVSIAASVALLVGAYRLGTLHGFHLLGHPVSEEGCLAITIVLSVISLPLFLGWALGKLDASGLLRTSLKSALSRLCSQANMQLTGMEELVTISNKIAGISKALGIEFQTDYLQRLREFVEANKLELLKSTVQLDHVLDSLIGQAREDYLHLAQSSEDFETANAAFLETANRVNRSGSRTLIQLLDQLATGMEALKDFLRRKAWRDFQINVDFAIRQLAELSQSADNYTKETGNGSDQDERATDPFAVLGVTPEATDEEIRRVKLRLSQIYHPDAGIVTDSDQTRMKEINWAYDQLRAMRKGLGADQ